MAWLSPAKVELDMKEKDKVIDDEELFTLFKARCQDLQFTVNAEQFERFNRYISKNSYNGKLKLINLGLSENSAKALQEILRTNMKIKRLYLSRNKLHDEGAQILAKAIKNTDCLIHLDISSNEIYVKGFESIFKVLYHNNTIVSLNLASSDRSYRNRLGLKGAQMLSDLLKHSNYIQFLNVSSTGLWNDGVKALIEGIKDNQVIVSLIMKANEMTSVVVPELAEAVLTTSLQYLDISHNNIGNTGMSDFCGIIRSERCALTILKLKDWGFNFIGAIDLYNAVKYNRTIKELYIDKNKLVAHNFSELRLLFWTNNYLKLLSMNECDIGDKGATAIAEGLIRNNVLTHLFLRNNDISDEPGKDVLSVLQYPRKCPIEVMNLANNLLGDQAGRLLMTMLPRLKNPPIKLNLENNLLKTHKYKLLRLFVEKNVNSVQLQHYKEEKRRKRQKLFKDQIFEEKEEMKNDPQEYKDVLHEQVQLRKRKSQQRVEINGINKYFKEQIAKQNL